MFTEPEGKYLPAEMAPGPLPDPSQVSIEGLRIAMWNDDGLFAAAPAIRRAVAEAAEALRQRGATVESFQPPRVGEAMDLYYGLLAADGGADARRLAAGSPLAPPLKRLLGLAGIPNLLRPVLVTCLRWTGRQRQAQLLRAARPGSADRYWQLTYRMRQYIRDFQATLEQAGYDALLCPPHALPAPPHGRAIELVPAATYSFLFNLLSLPAGVVAATRVRAQEETDRPRSADPIDRLARRVETGSTGLPVGVQVAAHPWREDIVLALMAALENHFQNQPDYPCHWSAQGPA